MPSFPVISTMAWFPPGFFSPKEESKHLERLTIVPKHTGPGDPPKPIAGYVRGRNGNLGFPIDYATRLLGESHAREIANTVQGFPVAYKKIPTPRDEAQREFWRGLLSTAQEGRLAFLAQAPTGFGKTISAAYLAASLGRKMLVMVPKTNLVVQWAKEMRKHLGAKVAMLYSGSEHTDWRQADIVISTIHQIYQTKRASEFYNSFGLVVWDECHRLGAREFYRTVGKFRAATRMGLSARPSRKDGCDELFFNYFGKPRVVATSQPCPCNVYTVRVDLELKTRRRIMASGRNRPRAINALASCVSRNRLIVSYLLPPYEKGKQMLVLSDRIEQLGILRYMLASEGVPESDIGIYAGEYFDPITGKRRAIKQAELDLVAANCRIILASNGLGREALNIPRLDWGMDVTPSGEGLQAIGRIRRQYPGKEVAVWFTMLDNGVPMSKGLYQARVKDYRASGAILKN